VTLDTFGVEIGIEVEDLGEMLRVSVAVWRMKREVDVHVIGKKYIEGE
jgi:hypothetical protein